MRSLEISKLRYTRLGMLIFATGMNSVKKNASATMSKARKIQIPKLTQLLVKANGTAGRGTYKIDGSSTLKDLVKNPKSPSTNVTNTQVSSWSTPIKRAPPIHDGYVGGDASFGIAIDVHGLNAHMHTTSLTSSQSDAQSRMPIYVCGEMERGTNCCLEGLHEFEAH